MINIQKIYKYSLNDEIKKNIATSVEYFSEAIKWKNDALLIHNLLNIFIYDATSKDDFFFSLYDIHKNFVWISINLSENNGKKKKKLAQIMITKFLSKNGFECKEKFWRNFENGFG